MVTQEEAYQRHAFFCEKIGIVHYNVTGSGWWKTKTVVESASTTATPLESVKGSYYAEILSAYDNHTYQYWLVASVINILYLAQIVIGATATALGAIGATGRASQARTTAITILTAVGTIVAGVLAFLKSRGQPNRVRQLRNDLRRVCDQVRYLEMELCIPECTKTVEQALNEVKDLYDVARRNAETNYPDTWSISPDPNSRNLSLGNKTGSDPQNRNDNAANSLHGGPVNGEAHDIVQ